MDSAAEATKQFMHKKVIYHPPTGHQIPSEPSSVQLVQVASSSYASTIERRSRGTFLQHLKTQFQSWIPWNACASTVRYPFRLDKHILAAEWLNQLVRPWLIGPPPHLERCSKSTLMLVAQYPTHTYAPTCSILCTKWRVGS